MRISDWSSDVCSSDLRHKRRKHTGSPEGLALAEKGTATAAAALVAENIHKSFGELEVLKGVSLTAREGDVIAMLGSSGSGKSTFLRCMNLLERPNAGRIVVAGEALRLKPAKNGGSSAERRVGKECDGRCRAGGGRDNKKQ